MKKIIITGGNRGIGKAIACCLAEMGHEAVIVSRDLQNGLSAKEEICKAADNQNLHVLQGDLSTITGCLDLSEKIKAEHPDASILINNAGVWMTKRVLNENNLELNFMINHLAPALLSLELADLLGANEDARIVNVNAGLFTLGNFDPEKTPCGLDFHKIKTYATSKLCSVLFMQEVAENFKSKKVTINSVHPGVINTQLGQMKGPAGFLLKMIKKLWKSPEYGAIAPVWLATSPETAPLTGRYFNEKTEIALPDKVTDREKRSRLWNLTCELIASKVPSSVLLRLRREKTSFPPPI